MNAIGSKPFLWLIGLIGLLALSLGLLLPVLSPARSSSSLAESRVGRFSSPEHAGSGLPAAVAAAAVLPANVDWVVVLENAESMSQTAVGAALSALFRGQDADGASFESIWQGLAGQLEWDARDTFDRLLGRRVIFVARGVERGQTARWALLSRVSRATDLRLKERLQAAPRTIENGLPILALESGLYELTSAPGSSEQDDQVTLVLGPSGRTELFDELVLAMSRGSSSVLADQPVTAAASELGDSQILVLHRLPSSPTSTDPAGGRASTWDDFFIAGARTDPTDPSKLITRILRRTRGDAAENLRIAESSSDVFESMKSDSVLAIMQAAPLQRALGSWAAIIDAVRDLPVPERARAYIGQRVAICLRRAPSDRLAGEQLAATVAIEARAPAELAKSMDGSIARFVRAIEQSGDSDPPPVDFAGQLPSIVRVQPLKMSSSNPLRSFVSSRLAMAWSYPLAAPVESEAAGASPYEQRPGWCIITAAPASLDRDDLAAALHREVAGRVTALQPASTRKRWIWLTYARPAELDRVFTGPVPLAGLAGEVAGSTYRALARATDELEFRLSVSPTGDLEGELTLRLLPLAEPVREPKAVN